MQLGFMLNKTKDCRKRSQLDQQLFLRFLANASKIIFPHNTISLLNVIY